MVVDPRTVDRNIGNIRTNTAGRITAEYGNNPTRSFRGTDIDHSKTKATSPQTNGICERFHKTILNEFVQTAFRKKLYQNLKELQADADEWIRHYNEERPGSGRYC